MKVEIPWWVVVWATAGSNMSPGPATGVSSPGILGNQLWISRTQDYAISQGPPVKKRAPGGERHTGRLIPAHHPAVGASLVLTMTW